MCMLLCTRISLAIQINRHCTYQVKSQYFNSIFYLNVSSPASLWFFCLLADVSCLGGSFSFTCPLRVSVVPLRFAWAAASPEIVVLRLCFAEPLSLLSPMFAIIVKQTDTLFLSCSSRLISRWIEKDAAHQAIRAAQTLRNERGDTLMHHGIIYSVIKSLITLFLQSSTWFAKCHKTHLLLCSERLCIDPHYDDKTRLRLYIAYSTNPQISK